MKTDVMPRKVKAPSLHTGRTSPRRRSGLGYGEQRHPRAATWFTPSRGTPYSDAGGREMKKLSALTAVVVLLVTMGVFPNAAWALTAAEAQKLLASDGAAGDEFGRSVYVSGDTALIGAIGDDDNGSFSGSAYVFIRDATGLWTEQAKLLASAGAAGDAFGRSVSVSGDTALIGAATDDDLGSFSGSAYVFIRDATGLWTEQAKLLASDGAASDQFGVSVSVSDDTALIGAHVGFSSGSADVFTRDATGLWTQQAKLLPSDGAFFDLFGFSVSVSGDTALIGAFLDDDLGTSSGSAYVFSLSDPVSLISDLILQVMALNLQQGIANSLDAKLDSVLNALDDVNQNNDVAAINSLEAFINAVEAQRGVHLTDAQADQLVTAVLQIIDLILSG